MASFYSGVFLATSGSSLKDDLELIVFLCVYFPFLFFFICALFKKIRPLHVYLLFTIFDV